uniref:-1 frameshifting occurs in the 'slippery' sequence region n=1 Tax=Scenedesmus quadricauda TaxID=3089 RepID=O79545_SCEQU|nr:unnamed protein product [Scenedesmus quadricauda]
MVNFNKYNEKKFGAYYRICSILSDNSGGGTVRYSKQRLNTRVGKCKLANQAFLEWFIGFFEGDGSLIMTKRGNLMFVITIHTRDKQILEKIQKTLGFGSVIVQGPTTHRYVVQNHPDLYKILCILNGNLILPARKEILKKFVRAYNEKALRNNLLPVNHKESVCLPAPYSAWTCGFTDAEGCFTISFLPGTPFRIRYILTQKTTRLFYNTLLNFFNTGAIEKHSRPNVFSYVMSACKNCYNVVYPYFKEFPLQTKKAQSFKIWSEIHCEIERKQHLIPSRRVVLKELAKTINNQNKLHLQKKHEIALLEKDNLLITD